MTSAARRTLAVLALAVSALAAACADLDEGTTPRCIDTDPPTSTDDTGNDKCFTERIAPAGSAGSGGDAGSGGESGSSGQAGSGGSDGESGESGAGGSD